MNDGTIPRGPPSLVHTFKSVFEQSPTIPPPPQPHAPIYPDVAPSRPALVHLFPSWFGAPKTPAPQVHTAPVYPNTAPTIPSRVHLLQSWIGPSSSTIANLGFPGFGPAGAATFRLDLESGAKLTYSWGTDIFKSYSGLEQRCNTTGPRPRQRFEGNAFLLDADTRTLRGALQRAAAQGSTFLLALPHEELPLSADSIGTMLPVTTTALSDWAIVTQRVVILGTDGSNTPAVIQSVTATTIAIDVALGAAGRAGSRIQPLIQILLEPQQGFSRYPVNLDTWSIRATANVFGWTGQDVMGRGALIATYASGPVAPSAIGELDLPIWDRPNLTDETAPESMLSLAELVDLGGVPFSAGGAAQPDWARSLKYSSANPIERQWLKAFLRLCLGRQRAFALSTNRPDLVFVSAVGSTLKVTTAGDYTSWYASVAHRLLALTKADSSVQYVGVGSLTDNHDGTLSLGLDAVVTGTVTKVSFLEIVRFDNGDSDDFAVTWDGPQFAVDLIARTTEEAIVVPVALPVPPMYLVIGDSIPYGIGIGDTAKQDDATIGTGNAAIPYLHHGANGTGPPPVFVDYPSTNTFGPLNLYAASNLQSMGFEITLGPALKAALGSVTPYLLKSCVAGATLATEWDPSGTYPASGSGNLYNSTVTLAHTMEASSGSKVAVVFVVLGTNDALSGTFASNFATNAANLNTHLASDFPGTKIVWLKVNTNTDPGHAANVTTIRAGLVTALTGNASAKIVEYDDCALLGDTLHPTTESYLAVGPRLAGAALDLQGIARAPLLALGATGWGLSWGPGASGTGALTPHGSGLAQNGHRELCVVTTGIIGGTIPVPTSADVWTQIGSTIASTSSGVTEQMAVFTRNVTTSMLNANGGHTSPTTVTPATTARHMAKIFNVHRACSVDTSAGTSPGTFGTGPTTFSALAMSAGGMALLFPGGYCGSDPTQSATNGTLANFGKATDSSFNILSDRQILACFAGTNDTSSGAWSVSTTLNAVELGIGVALKP